MTAHRSAEVVVTGRTSPDRDAETGHALLPGLIFALGLFLTVAGVGMLTAAVAAYVWPLL
jgi:hypothetical protein